MTLVSLDLPTEQHEVVVSLFQVLLELPSRPVHEPYTMRALGPNIWTGCTPALLEPLLRSNARPRRALGLSRGDHCGRSHLRCEAQSLRKIHFASP